MVNIPWERHSGQGSDVGHSCGWVRGSGLGCLAAMAAPLPHTSACAAAFVAYSLNHAHPILPLPHAAELLTAGKLSELAALALFLMYEKKLGEDSFWQPYIKVC